MRTCYILRGLPGSGKSTRARELAGTTGIIHSTDDFFLDSDGVYRFDVSRLSEYHERNFAMFTVSVEFGLSPVVVDNTNIRLWQYERYKKFAVAHKYEVIVIALPHPSPEIAASRTIHGVPLAHIRKMLAEWEPSLI